MRPEPFYGTGQGATDSMQRWSILNYLLIRLYKESAISGNIVCPISRKKLLSIIKAYVDDTYSTMIATNINQLIKMFTTMQSYGNPYSTKPVEN
jgi:hypothetical protein